MVSESRLFSNPFPSSASCGVQFVLSMSESEWSNYFTELFRQHVINEHELSKQRSSASSDSEMGHFTRWDLFGLRTVVRFVANSI